MNRGSIYKRDGVLRIIGGEARSGKERLEGVFCARRRGVPKVLGILAFSVLASMWSVSGFGAPDQQEERAVALKLAEMLRAARAVVSQNQALINDPSRGDKGLTADVVLGEAVGIYKSRNGADPLEGVDPREERLLKAQMDAIREVVDENQARINAQGVGFKAFIPATFARLVNESFAQRVGPEANVKVTAPEPLVRNRKARPDEWEIGVITGKFSRADWPKGEPFTEIVDVGGRQTFRFIVPEYYTASCLACHGEPAGQMDITGYPKEGGHEGDLGAAISVMLAQ